MAHSLGPSPRRRSIPAAAGHFHLQSLKCLVPVYHWCLATLWKQWELLAPSKESCWLLPAQLSKWMQAGGITPNFKDLERRSALYPPLPLISLLHNLVSPFFCAQRRLHSLSTTLPSSMPDAQLNEFGRRVDMTTLPWCLLSQDSHLTPSPPSTNANRSF